jgi:MYXO-CTERM domain-containing protein
MKKREAFANRKEVYQILWLGANLGCAVISGGSNDSALTGTLLAIGAAGLLAGRRRQREG